MDYDQRQNWNVRRNQAGEVTEWTGGDRPDTAAEGLWGSAELNCAPLLQGIEREDGKLSASFWPKNQER